MLQKQQQCQLNDCPAIEAEPLVRLVYFAYSKLITHLMSYLIAIGFDERKSTIGLLDNARAHAFYDGKLFLSGQFQFIQGTPRP